MKRIIAILILVFLLTGCAGPARQQAAAPVLPAETETAAALPAQDAPSPDEAAVPQEAEESGKSPMVIACLGDSITFGTGVVDTRETEAYPAVLQQLAGESARVLNYGLSRRTMQDSGDYPYRAEEYYRQALADEADIYLLMLGTNDTKPHNWNAEGYAADLADTVRTLRALPGQPLVILMQPPRCFPGKNGEEHPYSIDNELIRTEVYRIIGQTAEETGADLIDLYTFTEDHPEWFPDGVHPNAEGNRAIAERIFSRLPL